LTDHCHQILLGAAVIELEKAPVVGAVAVKADVGRSKLGFTPRHGLGVVPGPCRKVLMNKANYVPVARRRVIGEVGQFGHHAADAMAPRRGAP